MQELLLHKEQKQNSRMQLNTYGRLKIRYVAEIKFFAFVWQQVRNNKHFRLNY